MNSLQNKRVLLGVTGGIAAYKSADLVRRLADLGAEVRVVMTRGACEFITPLTLQAVSGHRVYSELLDTDAEAAMGHIELARWADVIVIAPVTADALARFVAGRADDLLTTLLRASDAPVLLAPAMNQAMWRDAATSANYRTLMERGYHFVGPDEGVQACGDVGAGRMSEPVQIAEATAQLFANGLLQGLSLVITAGPTQEAIDPVRYLSNHSSGKMGFALAEAAAEAGAKVTLIAGPVALATPDRVKRINVISADQMLDKTISAVEGADIFIATAAVADFKPAAVAAEKIKKTVEQQGMTLELVKTPDILAAVATSPQRPSLVVGFAAETHNVAEYAQRKRERKNLDIVVANDVSKADIGFASEHNAVTVISANGQTELPKMHKHQLARQLIELLASKIAVTER